MQDDLAKSWEIVDETPKQQFDKIETLLYNAETRQRLVNDLEELLCYLQQREFELSREDQAMFDVYSKKEQNALKEQCEA